MIPMDTVAKMLRAMYRRDVTGWRDKGVTDGVERVRRFELELGEGCVLIADIDCLDVFETPSFGLCMDNGFSFETSGLRELIGFESVLDIRGGATQVHIPYGGPFPRSMLPDVFNYDPGEPMEPEDEDDAPIWHNGGDGHGEQMSDPVGPGNWCRDGLVRLARLAIMRDISTVDGMSQWDGLEITDTLTLGVSARLGNELPTDIVLRVWFHPPGDHIDFSFSGSAIPAAGGVVIAGENARILIPMDESLLEEASSGYGHMWDTPGYLGSVGGGMPS